ncbi:hypothetical protein ACMYYO_00440 [Dermacoccaceae bacterium W4C1]
MLRRPASAAAFRCSARGTPLRSSPSVGSCTGLGLRYRVERSPLPKQPRRADIVFGPAKVAVFIDGCFWHGLPRTRSAGDAGEPRVLVGQDPREPGPRRRHRLPVRGRGVGLGVHLGARAAARGRRAARPGTD